MNWAWQFFRLQIFFDPKFLWTQNLSDSKFSEPKLLDQNLFGRKICRDPKYFWPTFLWTLNFFEPNTFLDQIIFLELNLFWDLTLLLTQNLFGPQMHLKLEFDSGVGPTCLLMFHPGKRFEDFNFYIHSRIPSKNSLQMLM